MSDIHVWKGDWYGDGEMWVAAESEAQAKDVMQRGLDDWDGFNIVAVDLNTVMAYMRGNCGERDIVEQMSMRELIAFHSSRGCRFPAIIAQSGEYC